MLSRSIYNLNRALEREFADGEGVGEALHRSLIDVMDHWHEMALDMEAELEACQTRQDQMRPSAGEVVDTATRRGMGGGDPRPAWPSRGRGTRLHPLGRRRGLDNLQSDPRGRECRGRPARPARRGAGLDRRGRRAPPRSLGRRRDRGELRHPVAARDRHIARRAVFRAARRGPQRWPRSTARCVSWSIRPAWARRLSNSFGRTTGA